MFLLTCQTQTVPCPLAEQGVVDSLSFLDPTQLGISPESVLMVISWGFGFILTSFLLGWTVSLAIGLIRKL